MGTLDLVGDAEDDGVPVCDELSDGVEETVGDRDGAREPEGVEDLLAVTEPLLRPEKEYVGECEVVTVGDFVPIEVSDSMPRTLHDGELVNETSATDAVSDGDCETELDCEGDDDGDVVLECRGELEGELDTELEPELLLEPRFDKVAFAETDAVAVPLALREAEGLIVDDIDDVDDVFEDLDLMIVVLADTEGDSLINVEVVPVVDIDGDSEDVIDADGEDDCEPVVEAVRDLVPAPVLDIEAVEVTDGLLDFVLEFLDVVEGVTDRLEATESVEFAEDVIVRVTVTVPLTLNDAVPMADNDGDTLTVLDIKTVTVGVEDDRTVAAPELEMDTLPLTEGDIEYEAELEEDTDDIGENESLMEDDADADDETMSENLAVKVIDNV